MAAIHQICTLVCPGQTISFLCHLINSLCVLIAGLQCWSEKKKSTLFHPGAVESVLLSNDIFFHATSIAVFFDSVLQKTHSISGFGRVQSSCMLINIIFTLPMGMTIFSAAVVAKRTQLEAVELFVFRTVRGLKKTISMKIYIMSFLSNYKAFCLTCCVFWMKYSTKHYFKECGVSAATLHWCTLVFSVAVSSSTKPCPVLWV